jgi:transposase InsO family protein
VEGRGPVGPGARRDRSKAEIARLFAARNGKDGSPRITAALRDAGWVVSKNTVAALMAEMGPAARRKRGRKVTTRPGKGRWRAPDRIRRDFAAAGINRKWYGDGTEIGTGEGKLFHLVALRGAAWSGHRLFPRSSATARASMSSMRSRSGPQSSRRSSRNPMMVTTSAHGW